MAEIILATIENRGNRLGRLSNSDKQYIDQSYMYEPPGTMAAATGANILQVINYCTAMGYKPSDRPRKKPKKTSTQQVFDVDAYSRTITI